MQIKKIIIQKKIKNKTIMMMIFLKQKIIIYNNLNKMKKIKILINKITLYQNQKFKTITI